MSIKESNLNKIRSMAITLLNLEIRETKIPFIATHPFTDSWKIYLGDFLDLHEKKNQIIWRKHIESRLNESSLIDIFFLLNKPYILTFLKYIEEYISDDDLGLILNTFWHMIEQISNDPNITSSQIVKFFKRASKKTLMSENELLYFQNLSDTVTIYRGVTSYNQKNERALSWTTDEKVAKWFATRFDTKTGEVWKVTLPKRRILCYFSERNENEVIVDLHRLKNLNIEKHSMIE